MTNVKGSESKGFGVSRVGPKIETQSQTAAIANGLIYLRDSFRISNS